MPVKMLEDPLSLQERLKDMQALLLLKSIRADHDSVPTVLSAIDHAIAIIQERHDRKKKEAQDDFRLSFMREALARVERGDAVITNVGIDRARMIPGSQRVIYNISILGDLRG